MVLLVRRVEQRNIVVNEQIAVIQRKYDTMQIHHVVKQNVQTDQ